MFPRKKKKEGPAWAKKKIRHILALEFYYFH